MAVKKRSKKETYKERVNRIFIRYERSKAYAEFCRRLFGKNLCQVSMVDMAQLNKLLSVLRLSKDSKVLDLGCGMGVISEYISDTTKAHVTGLDFADRVIKRARQRTKKKRARLTFCVGDFNKLLLPNKSYDIIIAIDSLYFVKNLEKTIKKIKTLSTPAGQMGIFYTQTVKPNESSNLLKARNTKLAKVLKKLKLKFRTWDYTENEINHWKKRKKIALKLQSAFRSERNFRMGKELIKEAEFALKFVNSNRISRYLYHIRVQ